jgi:hypothetical protein
MEIQKEPAMQHSHEIMKITQELYRTWQKGDPSYFSQMLSGQEGVLVIGTDPAEWWGDYAMIQHAIGEQIPAMAGFGFESNLETYSHGEVGWFADQAVMTMPDGMEIPMRITGVYERQNGAWYLVQMHTSIGIPNEEAGFGDL